MKRSLLIPAVALVLSSLVMTGCGQKPATGVMLPSKLTARKPAASSATNVATPAAGTGSLVLQLSSLKGYSVQATKADVAALEIKMTGPGLATPLAKKMTASELKSSNTVAFEGIPVGAYTVSLTAFDAKGANIGQKATDVEVETNQQTEVKLALKLNPSAATGSVKFDFDIIDGDAVAETPAATEEAPATEPDDEATNPGGSEDGLLGIEIVNKQINRKFLLFKKLEVTVKVTNLNATEALSGEVKVEYYKMSGLFTKEPKLVETLTQTVSNLPAGKSVEITLQSSKAADDAEATVHTVVSSASASTADEE